MKFTPYTRFAAATVLAACAAASMAQTPPQPAAPGGADHAQMHAQMHDRMQQHMQERTQRRMESVKRILQLSPAQEPAFNAWAGAMRPSQQAMQQHRGGKEEFARMSTPERIDRMRQMRAQRNADMDRRADATKNFYAQLNPQQQKAFDEVSMRFMARHRGHGGHRG